MLRRKIQESLLRWSHSSNRLPLVIKGCRQCGKTFSALEFARRNYEHVVYLDFFRNAEYASIFSGSLEVDQLTLMMSALLGPTKIPGWKSTL